MNNTISTKVAKEHLGDGQDNVIEAVKTIKRVLKSYPDLAPELNQAATHLTSARESMELASRRLPK
jgi:hypothetical protein